MPLSLGGSLHFVYSLSPTVVLRCDPVSGETERVIEAPRARETLENLRGGSQGVARGRRLPVRGARGRPDRARGSATCTGSCCSGKDPRLAGISPRFTFTTDRIEFCAGAACRDDSLVLSFGISDAAAGTRRPPARQALGLLEPVNAPSSPPGQKSWSS